MIEILTGQRETVIYDEKIPIRMHLIEDAEDFPLHWQYSYEIIMPLENGYTINIEEHTENLAPGDIIIISPGVLHSLIAPPTGSRYIFLVKASMFEAIAGTQDLHLNFYPYTIFTHNTNSNSREQLGQLLNSIWNEYSSNEDLKYLALYADIFSFFLLAGRNNDTQFLPFKTPLNSTIHEHIEKFQSICSYIATHCEEDISVQELASSRGFSVSHFYRLFKQYTGISYHKYLNQARITKAKQLLCQNEKITVLDISLRCGFSSLATFNRAFKTITKLTPSEYRSLNPQGN